jgi:hypothetical protein
MLSDAVADDLLEASKFAVADSYVQSQRMLDHMGIFMAPGEHEASARLRKRLIELP